MWPLIKLCVNALSAKRKIHFKECLLKLTKGCSLKFSLHPNFPPPNIKIFKHLYESNILFMILVFTNILKVRSEVMSTISRSRLVRDYIYLFFKTSMRILSNAIYCHNAQ
jgi:hypothetical protein